MNLGLIPPKRMGHAACIFGGHLVVYGGVYAEDASLRNDLCIFDIEAKLWMPVKCKYSHDEGHSSKIKSEIGELAYHTMNSISEPGINEKTLNSRLMWILNQKEASLKEEI